MFYFSDMCAIEHRNKIIDKMSDEKAELAFLIRKQAGVMRLIPMCPEYQEYVAFFELEGLAIVPYS